MLKLGTSEAQAQHLAFHDVLTGLPNRALVEDRLTQALALATRHDQRVALLLINPTVLKRSTIPTAIMPVMS